MSLNHPSLLPLNNLDLDFSSLSSTLTSLRFLVYYSQIFFSASPDIVQFPSISSIPSIPSIPRTPYLRGTQLMSPLFFGWQDSRARDLFGTVMCSSGQITALKGFLYIFFLKSPRGITATPCGLVCRPTQTPNLLPRHSDNPPQMPGHS